MSILDMTLNYIKLWSSSPDALENMEYIFIAITPRCKQMINIKLNHSYDIAMYLIVANKTISVK